MGVATSTVAGRLMMTGRSGVPPQASTTASHTSFAKSSSVAVNVSGLYWNTHSVSGRASVSRLMSCVLSTASCFTSSRLMSNTTRRKVGEVAL